MTVDNYETMLLTVTEMTLRFTKTGANKIATKKGNTYTTAKANTPNWK